MSSASQGHGPDGSEGEPTPPPEGSTPPPAQPPPQEQPPPQPQVEAGSSEGGLDPKVGGLLAYLLFGWIGGLIMFFTQKHPEVRFHGAQSVLFSIALFVIFVGLGILSAIIGFIPGLGIVSGLITLAVYPLLWLASVVLWIFLCIKGYSLEHFKLPMIGDMAEKWAAS